MYCKEMTMLVPTVGSTIRVKTMYSQGPRMIPPAPDHFIHDGKVVNPDRWLNDRQFCMTGDKNYPIRIINMDYVLDLEVISGSTIKVNTGVQSWTVEGSKGNKYTVTRSPKGWNCTCSGFQFRKQCKHVVEYSKKK